MALKITINVSGFERLGELARLNAREAVEEEIQAVAEEARTLAPVRTGALRDSIESSMNGEFSGEVTVGVDYAPFVEWGTRKMPPQPFMTPAFQRGQSRFPERVRQALEQAAKDASRGR